MVNLRPTIPLFVVGAQFSPSAAARPYDINHGKFSLHPRTFRAQRKSKDRQLDALTSIRGGDLGPIPAKALAKGFCGLVSLDAITGTLLPEKSMSMFGIEAPAKSLRRFTIEGVGGMAGGVLITSLFALFSDKPVDKAIAFGMLSPLFFFLRSSVSNPELSICKPSILAGGLLSIAIVATSLFDIADPKMAMKWIFGVDIVLSTLAYFFPEFGSKMTGIDAESEGELTTQCFRILCGYEAVFATISFLLLNGMEPIKALGYAAAVVTAWVFEMGMVTKVQDYLPSYWWLNNVTYALLMLLMGGMSFGMLTEGTVKATVEAATSS